MESLPSPFLLPMSGLHELSHKKLVDLLRAFQRFTIDKQYRNRLRPGAGDQLFLVLRILPNVFFDDLIFAVKVGHAIEHGLRKSAFIVEVQFQSHTTLYSPFGLRSKAPWDSVRRLESPISHTERSL